METSSKPLAPMTKITTYYKGDMLFQTRIGNHSLLADVPPLMGGKDRAPTPPELFIASLGTCVGALVAQYCGRSSIDANGMTVEVEFTKAEQPARLTNVVVTINMPHASCQNREEAIRRVAEYCPVHQTIVTELKDAEEAVQAYIDGTLVDHPERLH